MLRTAPRAACSHPPRLRCAPPAQQIAKRQGVVNPENTFYSVKRFIGRRMEEIGEESKARTRVV
jgi:molecular chaperone DnaK (HSP70)